MTEIIKHKILSFLNIRKDELHKLSLLFYLHILMGMVMVISFSISSSFFNISVGAAFLPWMFLILGVAKLPLSCFLGYLMSRAKIFFSARLTIIITIIIFLINSGLLYFNNYLDGYEKYIASFVYIASFLSIGIIANFNWIIASEVFTTQQSKRLLSYITGSVYVGSIIGGLILLNSIKLFGSAFLFLFCIFLLFQMILALNLLYKNYLKVYLFSETEEEVTMKETVNYFSKNNYAVFLLLFFILFEALRYFFVIKFNIAAESNFLNDENGLTQYFGYYESIAAFCSIVITFFFLNKFINFLGVWKTVIFIPAAFMLTFIMMFFSNMNLYFVTFIAVINEIIYYLIIPPILSLVHKPIELRMRSSIMSIINFFSSSMGEILSFCIGILITWNICDFSQFSIVALIIAFIAVIAAFLYRNNYLDVLTKAIASKSGDISEDSAALFSDFQSTAHLEQFKKLLDSQDGEVVILALQFLCNVKSDSICQIVLPLLNSENNDIRAEALRVLMNANLEFAKLHEQKIYEMLSDVSYRVRVRALEVLHKQKHDSAIKETENLINEMLESPSVERRILALETIGALKLVEFKDKIMPCLYSNDFYIKKTAVEILPKISKPGETHIIEILIELLKDAESEIRDVAVDALEIIIGDKIGMISRFVTDNNLIFWSNIIELLARLESKENYDYMNSTVLAHIHNIYENLIAIKELKKIPFTDAVEPMINKLLGKNQLIINTAFRTLSIKRGKDLVDNIARQLLNPDKNIKMNAIEALETAGDANIVKTIIPLFEWENDDDKIEAGKKMWKLENVKSQKILLDLLYDNDAWISACSAYIMGELSHDIFEKPLKEYLAKQEKNETEKNIKPNFLVIENIKVALRNIDTLRKLLLEDDFMMPEKTEALPIMERIIFLKKMPLFVKIDAETIMNIANLLEEKKYEKDDVIIKEGAESDSFYIIINGSVKKISEKSDEIKILKSYEYFGELVLLDKFNYPYSIISESALKVFVIKKRDFLMLLKKNSDIAVEFLKEISLKRYE